MIVTTKTEKFYRVEMTAAQRQNLIFGLIAAIDTDDNCGDLIDLSKEQKEVFNDLRQSLLNAP